MGRTTKTITFSLPPEMADQVTEIMKREGRTKSELLREALRRYIDDHESNSALIMLLKKALRCPKCQ